jgi:hypothetical protein
MAELFDSAPVMGPSTVNVLLYGAAGSGKTTAAASAPGPIVWINFEGESALSFARKRAEELGAEIKEVRIRPDEDPRPRVQAATDFVRAGQAATIVFDTFGKYREALAQAVGGDNVTLADWGVVGKTIRATVRELRDLRANVVLICHEEIVQGEEVIVQPLIGGKSTQEVCGEVDVIAYCSPHPNEDGVSYLGQLVEAKGRRAKDRSGALGVFRPLDLGEWFADYTAALALDVSDVPFLNNDEEGEGK